MRIETERLILREYVESDWEQVHLYSSDPEVSRYMIWGPNTEQDTKAFVVRVLNKQKEKPRTEYELAVVLKATGKVVGGIGLRLRNERKKDADIGYCFHRDMWGKGVGSEAAAAMLKLGFEHFGLHRIWATCDVENPGSAGVMRKNGMKEEAHFRRDELIKGQWRDTLLYAILEDEWRASDRSAAIDISTEVPT